MILIIDDDRAICSSLKLLMKGSGLDAHAVYNPQEAQDWLQSNQADLIILDMNFAIATTGKQGLRLLTKIRETDSTTPIILITGWGTLQLAVEGMKAGANDFITKPWDNAHLLQSVQTLISLRSKVNEDNRTTDFDQILGKDPAFLEMISMAKRVSATDASVLICGESGTGKELIAEAIHYNSRRCDEAFVKVNLGGISQSLFESEMFGHKKGAFTDAITDRQGRFEVADRGTIFLDEIGDLDQSSQVKLLRVLQEKSFEVLGSSQTKKVDFRVISATNKDLNQLVQADQFREDLFYRINLISLDIPPLRKRSKDIPLIANHYTRILGLLYEREDSVIDLDALEWLEHQRFPGNIRQLKNLIERTLLMSSSRILRKKDFQNSYIQLDDPTSKVILPKVGAITLEDLEKKMIVKSMDHHRNNISLAARSLGITRSALYRRLQKYNIEYES